MINYKKITLIITGLYKVIYFCRRHTLVFMPSRERVYAFGLGSTGQLGTKQLMNSTGPLVVQGPWLEGRLHIEALYSGGDQCFATVTLKVCEILLYIFLLINLMLIFSLFIYFLIIA